MLGKGVHLVIGWLWILLLISAVAGLNIAQLNNIRGVNLDFSGKRLQLDEMRYISEKENMVEVMLDLGIKLGNDFKGKFMKYEISNREDFDSKKMEYILSKSSKSVVLFKDTNTVLVPSEDIVKGNQQQDNVTFVEVDLLDCGDPIYESVLIPASPCLKFPLGGSGSVSVGYSVGVLIQPQGTASIEFLMSMIALLYEMAIGASLSASFSGTYLCNAVNGADVRLFYRIATIEVEPKERHFFYDRYRKHLYKGEWMNSKLQKFVTDLSPLYYCATSDKLDLMCDRPGIEYVDENGDHLRSYIEAESDEDIDEDV